MLFPTFTFAIFFIVVYGAHVALRSRPRQWKLAMLAASYVFYGWWDWRFCGLIAGASVFNWWAARQIHRRAGQSRRDLVSLAVLVNLAVLGFFKYWGFFVESFDAMFGSANPLPFIEVVLPVGISFYTFQALSYVIDVHRKEVKPAPLLDVAVFLAFFPQLVAGPIVRASEFLPQLRRRRFGDSVYASEAAWLIARGLFKKVVIATYLADTVVDPVFAAPNAATRIELFQAMYGYAIQIYADFSGYTDIAIGIALLLGFRFPKNFDNPYRALSIQDFWRRWHITLSNWLRDYLYIPLGGNRGGSLRTYRNLMITMLLGGLWHGAAWTFVVWGAIHGGALAIERFTQGVIYNRRKQAAAQTPSEPRKQLLPTGVMNVAKWVLTFHVVCIAWVLFRSSSFALAGDFLTGLISGESGGSVNWLVIATIIVALAIQNLPTDLLLQARERFADTDPVLQGAVLGIWISLVVALGPEGVAPFIYFQF